MKNLQGFAFIQKPEAVLTKVFITVIGILWVCNSAMLYAQSNYKAIQLFEPMYGKNSNVFSLANKTTKDVSYLAIKKETCTFVLGHRPDSLVIDLPLSDGTTFTAHIFRRNIFSPDVTIQTSSQQGEKKHKKTQNFLCYTGNVNGQKVSMVSLFFSEEAVWGLVSTNDGIYNIGKVPAKQPQKDEIYVIAKDIAVQEFQQSESCGVTENEVIQQASKIFPALYEAQKKGNILSDRRLKVELAVDMDYETYKTFGNSSDKAFAYATALITTVSQIFERDLNTELVISYLNIWTTPDPYYGSGTSSVLSSLKNYWRNNKKSVRRTLVHLLSTRKLGGGIASMNALCDTEDGFGLSGSLDDIDGITPLPKYSWDVKVVAHEIGHNFGSPHTHSCLWPGGAIDSCYSSEDGSCITTIRGREGTIMSYCHRTSGGSINMSFHPLCSGLMRAMAEKALCVGKETLLSIYTLSGTIRFENGSPSGNTELKLWTSNNNESQKVIATIRTDAGGNYRFQGLSTGQYKIELPSNLSFVPTAGEYPSSVIVAGTNTVRNATVTRSYTISVKNSGGKAHTVLVVGSTIDGTFSKWRSDGQFTFNLPNGTYSFIATDPQAAFTPAIQQFTVNNSNLTLPNFTTISTPGRYSISGSVIDNEGNGLTGVTIQIEGASVYKATTDKNGAFIISGLPPAKYKVTASATGYEFPSHWTYNITDNDGWYADFRARALPKCSGTTQLTSMSGAFSDRTSGALYGSNTDCSWLITPQGSNNNRVKLSFTSFNTEDEYDVMTIYDGTNTFAKKLGEFSGNKLPQSVTSSGNALLVVFKTDNTNEYSGWTANYTTVQAPSAPVLFSPQKFSVVTKSASQQSFRWSAVADATAYKIQIGSDTSYTDSYISGGVAAIIFPGSKLLDTTIQSNELVLPMSVIVNYPSLKLYWRVQALSGVQNLTEFSSSNIFLKRPAITSTPSVINFAMTNVGSSSELSLSFTSTKIATRDTIVCVPQSLQQPFSMVLSGNNNSFIIRAANPAKLKVRFAPTNAGNFVDTVRIVAHTAGFPETADTIILPVSGNSAASGIIIRNFNPQAQQNSFQLDRSSPRDSGFVHGTNLDFDRAKATAFTLPEPQTTGLLSQVNVWFAFKRIGLTTQSYKIELYHGNASSGPTGLPIASKEYKLAGVNAFNTSDLSVFLPAIPTIHVFSPPVSVGKNFFAAVNFGSYSIQDVSAAGIVANGLVGKRVAEDWEQSAQGVWGNMSDNWYGTIKPDGWNMWIEAVIQGNATNVLQSKTLSELMVSHYPHPAHDVVSVQYTLQKAAQVQLELFTIIGQKIAEILNEHQTAGNYVVPVDLRQYPAGQYFYRLNVGAEQMVRLLQVVR